MVVVFSHKRREGLVMGLELWLGAAVAIGVPFVGFLRHRRRRRLVVQREAVRAIGSAVTELSGVVQQADVVSLDNSDVAGAVRRFDQEWQQWEYQLPEGSAHLRRSVREAMANCFGGPATVGLDPRCETLPRSAFDTYWWELLVSYLDHVRFRFSRWLVEDAPVPLVTEQYFSWRRDEDEEHRSSKGCVS
jgi:hypothetical protein